MTPQEKAKQLYGKYYGIPLYIKTVKECCHIAVDEIIQTLNNDIKDLDVRGSVLIDLIIYWRQVKEEIEKL
jgi:hypothetical protein